MTDKEHEDRAQRFVAMISDQIISIVKLTPEELAAKIFAMRSEMIQELRALLREERKRGHDDARQALRERITKALEGAIW